MAVPDFQSVMLPLLAYLARNNECTMSELGGGLAKDLGLTEADLSERLSKGGNVFQNRVGWARTYLGKAGLIEIPRKGSVRITESGRELVRVKRDRITVGFLREQSADFRAWAERNRANRRGRREPPADASEDLPPREMLEAGYETLKREVIATLQEQLKAVSPSQFEVIVVQLMRSLGYGALGGATQTPLTGDGGVDGVIAEDKLGLDTIYIQAKRWEGTVNTPTVQAFAGALDGYGAKKGVMVTTSSFSSGAHEYAGRVEKRIVLINGDRLAELMYETGLGVITRDAFEVKEVDTDFFVED